MAETETQTVHVILTAYETGIGVRSPQMPELFAGYPQLFEALAAVPELLEFGGASAGATVIEHREYPATTPDDRVLLLRVADDADFSRRALVLGAIRRAVEGMGEELVDTLVPTSLGEHVLIAALHTDSIEWLTSQADRAGEPVNLAWLTPSGTLHWAIVMRGEDGGTTVGALIEAGSMSSVDTSRLQLVGS